MTARDEPLEGLEEFLDPRNVNGSNEQVDMLMDVTAAFDMSDADGLSYVHRVIAEGVDYEPIRRRLLEMDGHDRWRGRQLQRRALASLHDKAKDRSVRRARQRLLEEGLPVSTITELRSAA